MTNADKLTWMPRFGLMEPDRKFVATNPDGRLVAAITDPAGAGPVPMLFLSPMNCLMFIRAQTGHPGPESRVGRAEQSFPAGTARRFAVMQPFVALCPLCKNIAWRRNGNAFVCSCGGHIPVPENIKEGVILL